MDALQYAITSFEKVQNIGFHEIVCQTQLIHCIKSLMNNKDALEVLIKLENGPVESIFPIVLNSSNVLMKSQLLKLFAALALYSNEGYKYSILLLPSYSCLQISTQCH